MSNTDEFAIAQEIITATCPNPATNDQKIEAIQEVLAGRWDDPISDGKMENWPIRRAVKEVLLNFSECDAETKKKGLYLAINELVAQSAEIGEMDA